MSASEKLPHFLRVVFIQGGIQCPAGVRVIGDPAGAKRRGASNRPWFAKCLERKSADKSGRFLLKKCCRSHHPVIVFRYFKIYKKHEIIDSF